jgi:hypothetical protein
MIEEAVLYGLAMICRLQHKTSSSRERPSCALHARTHCSYLRGRVFISFHSGAITEIEIENALDLESLSGEFQFVELGGGLANSFHSTFTSRLSGFGRGLKTCRGS